nr:hypothetical protein [Tanacetum cinerariifolium]
MLPIIYTKTKAIYQDIKLDTSVDLVEDAKVEDYQVDESEVDDVAFSEPQVDAANIILVVYIFSLSSGNRIGKNHKMSLGGSCVWDLKMTERSKSKITRRSFNQAKSVVRRRRKRSYLDGNCDVLLDEYKVEHVCNASSDGNADVGGEETGGTQPPSEQLAICATLVMNEEMEGVAISNLVMSDYQTTPPSTPLESPPTTPIAPQGFSRCELLTTPNTTPLPLTSPPPTPTQPSKQFSSVTLNIEPVKLIFSTPPTSHHPFFDSLEDLPPHTINPPPSQPTFDTNRRFDESTTTGSQRYGTSFTTSSTTTSAYVVK